MLMSKRSNLPTKCVICGIQGPLGVLLGLKGVNVVVVVVGGRAGGLVPLPSGDVDASCCLMWYE